MGTGLDGPPNTSMRREPSTLQKRAPLDIVIPTTASVPPCSELSRYGLETLTLVALPE